MRPQRLNPADQFTLMMDHEIRASALAGNFCAFVFELEGIPDVSTIKQKCARFSQRFPKASARLRNAGRHFEWHQGGHNTIPFYQHATDQNESDKVVSVLNQSMPLTDSAPVEFHLITGSTSSQFVIRWFHPVCDAKGAELMLYHLFNETDDEPDQNESAIHLLLNQWSMWEKIKLGYKAKKNIDQLDHLSSILPCETTKRPNHVNTKVMTFSPTDSQHILKLARKSAGISGISLYFIGCMMRALAQSNNLDDGEAFCVPYAVNLRKRKSLFPVFGNQVCFLFAQASKEMVKDRQTLFTHLREQNKTAIKQNLDRAMLPLMQAGSWLKPEKYGKIVRQSPQGRERSSFWFSYTGSMDPEPDVIGESPITSMFQFSLVTAPPSLGLLVNHFQDKIIISYNYVENQFEPQWNDQLLARLKSELLGVE